MHCLIIGKTWPEPASTAAGCRTLDLIRAFKWAGWRVSFASAAKANAHAADLAEFAVATTAVRVNDSAFDVWVAELAPDVVVFDRFMTEEQFGWRVEKQCPNALRVLDTSDLHCLREARHEALKSGGPPDLFNYTALREIAAIHRCDLNLVISEYEYQLLLDVFKLPESQVMYWPFLLDVGGLPDIESGAEASFEARQHCLMIGNFQHAPNLDAARWCRQVIWPLIREAHPGVELHIFGSYGEAYGKELSDIASGVRFCGRAAEVVSTMRDYRVNLAPLRFGAGLKGKLFDGFRSGTPSCTTPIGVEGIAPSFEEWGCGVFHEPKHFAETAASLYGDFEQWQGVRRQGALLARQRFDARQWMPRLIERIEKAYAQIEENRASNFIGRLLRHHHQRSTEFMSRWIESKQQNQ